jgi:hypothetical protein
VLTGFGIGSEEFFQPPRETVQGTEHVAPGGGGLATRFGRDVLKRWGVLGQKTSPEIPEVAERVGRREERYVSPGRGIPVAYEEQFRLNRTDLLAKRRYAVRGREIAV